MYETLQIMGYYPHINRCKDIFHQQYCWWFKNPRKHQLTCTSQLMEPDFRPDPLWVAQWSSWNPQLLTLTFGKSKHFSRCIFLFPYAHCGTLLQSWLLDWILGAKKTPSLFQGKKGALGINKWWCSSQSSSFSFKIQGFPVDSGFPYLDPLQSMNRLGLAGARFPPAIVLNGPLILQCFCWKDCFFLCFCKAKGLLQWRQALHPLQNFCQKKGRYPGNQVDFKLKSINLNAFPVSKCHKLQVSPGYFPKFPDSPTPIFEKLQHAYGTIQLNSKKHLHSNHPLTSDLKPTSRLGWKYFELPSL